MIIGSPDKYYSISKRLKEARKFFNISRDAKVSFPIATYNREEILVQRTIPSILNQEYTSVEIVIVGDGIKSSSEDYIRRSICDPRVIFFNLKKRTKYPEDPFDLWCVAGYRPRNIAARIASGDYHWWMSDDDEILPEGISTLIEYLKKNTHDKEVFSGNILNSDGTITTPELAYSSHRLLKNTTGFPAFVTRNYISRIFQLNGLSYLNQVNKPCDYDFMHRMIESGVRFTHIPHVLARVNDALPDFGLQGSKAYIQHPDRFK